MVKLMAMKTTEERKEAAEKTYKAIQKRRARRARKIESDYIGFKIDIVRKCSRGKCYGKK